MPRTQKKKEIKKVELIEDVEPEPEQETETEQAPRDDVKDVKTPEPIAEPEPDIELVMPKKRTKQRTDKQLEQLRLAREKAMLNKELRRKQKEEEEQKIKQELEGKIQAEKKAIEQKIVKKALSIKKKEIKRQEILDEISDDETPIEKIKVPVKKEPNLKIKTNKTLYFD